ncbi:hypothetical protein HALLA_10280 [Halostagnicola larsenii XH-48]|uniref:PGF-CTERM sorting domain-containing protein n=1 Tax=Halostagnicola larsenii XH-48 TaxID=797299 RepID=W0JQK4_9EURY|nr:hypothetical protein [Halostagnicola larsenii]AHG00869.1 hypothetical protein HALLA_10280 [Halostagnicola larsenii XH-48]
MNRKSIAAMAVLGLVLVSGCLHMTATVEVSPDGDLETMGVEMEMNELLYDELESNAQADGYDSVAAMMEDEMLGDADEEHYEEVSSSVDELDNGDYRVSVSAHNVDPAGSDDINVTVNDDTIEFEDSGIIDDTEDEGDPAEYESEITVEYELIMPGEIQEHNADEISEDGTTATWDLLNADEETVYAESTIEDDGMPGFGIPAGLAAALVVIGVLGLSTRSS